MPDRTSLVKLHEILESPAYSALTRVRLNFAVVHRANWRSREAEEGAEACFRTLLEPWHKRNILILTPSDVYDRWSWEIQKDLRCNLRLL